MPGRGGTGGTGEGQHAWPWGKEGTGEGQEKEGEEHTGGRTHSISNFKTKQNMCAQPPNPEPTWRGGLRLLAASCPWGSAHQHNTLREGAKSLLQ